jgi:hypothetical protein
MHATDMNKFITSLAVVEHVAGEATLHFVYSSWALQQQQQQQQRGCLIWPASDCSS